MKLVTVLVSSFVTKLEYRLLVDQLDEEAVNQGVEVVDAHPVVFWLELPHRDDFLLLTLVTALASSSFIKLEDLPLVEKLDEP